jgi:glyoxalase family protein
MTSLRTAGIHHSTMVSSDINRSLPFYRDVLGLALLAHARNADVPDAAHLYFGSTTATPGSLLSLVEWPGAPKGRWGIGGVHHLALGVESRDALLKWKRWLGDHGVPAAGPYDRGYFVSLYFSDPDGQVLEIATRGPGYAIDEPADQLGERPLVPPGAQLRGARDEELIRETTWPEPVEAISRDMVLEGIHHISGITDDLVRANEFYEAALGLRLVKQSVNQDDPRIPHHFWARYENGIVAPHSGWTLFGWPAQYKRAHAGTGQTHHVSFRARDAEEQLAWRDHLLSIGVEVSPVVDRTHFSSIHFRAPDGQSLSIATDGPGFGANGEPGVGTHSLQMEQMPDAVEH